MAQEDNDTETLKIREKPATITWDYDEEADVLYLSVGEPQPAVGVNIGEGVVLRYSEARKQLVGVTLFGLRARLLKGLAQCH
jgi:uncharacterized protein YuzE